jgi:ATP-binding cassette subfamily G (WHITE) protein 2 (SNQ2)
MFRLFSVGIIIAFWIFFVALTAFSVERLKAAGSEKSYLLFKRTGDANDASAIATGVDEESRPVEKQSPQDQKGAPTAAGTIDKSTTVFTWK